MLFISEEVIKEETLIGGNEVPYKITMKQNSKRVILHYKYQTKKHAKIGIQNIRRNAPGSNPRIIKVKRR